MYVRIPFPVLLSAILAAAFAAVAAAQPLSPDNLRTEYLRDPMGIDTAAPRFSWWMRHAGRDQAQTAYQVQVATSMELLARDAPDCWDTGRVNSDANVHIEYQGKGLESFRNYYWRVRLWDRDSEASPYSAPASFETALLQQGDFVGKWICGAKDLVDSNGYHSKPFNRAERSQWVEIDLGGSHEVVSVALYPARPYDWKRDEPGFGFPVRYTISLSDTAGKADARVAADRSTEDQPNPGDSPVILEFAPQAARYARLDVSKLWANGEGKFLLALAEMEVRDKAGNNLALNREVSAASSLEEGAWRTDRLVNGVQKSQRGRNTSPLLRKEFTLGKAIRRARAYVSGLGYYELYLNGTRVGDRVLDPANTVHAKRTLYSTYDVTGLLRQGANAAGMMLGHGWWRDTCAAWLQLRVEYDDGSTETIVTDESWRWSTGPILEESLYNGETYDARLEQPGWDQPGFGDTAWQPVVLFETPPALLASQVMPPIRVTQIIKAVSVTPRPGGAVLVDFGQNLTGWIQLAVQGEAGDRVVMRHAELLYGDGALNPENLRSARATDTYVLKGGGGELYHPRFTQHGFRYAEVTGYPGELTTDKLEAQVIHTDFERSGDFACSSSLFNKIRDISLWSIRGNNMSIPTDCPQRDERMGWMGDAHLAAEASILNFDFAAYYENWLRVIANSQDEEGHVPDTSPLGWGKADGSPPWAIAYPLVAWYSWRYYANRRVVEEHYDNIVRWFRTMEGHAKDNILEYCHYGDWVGVEKTPMPPIGTGCYYWTAEILEEFAGVLGKEEDQKAFAQRKQDIAAAYNARFFNQGKGYYDEGSQFSQIFPLYLGIAGEHHDAALAHLKHEILERRNGHLATGILGTKYLFDVLSDTGNVDVAYRVAGQGDYPGWGFMIANDATTLWELWTLDTGGGMNSHNHQMFGSVVDWFFGDVAGINKLPDPGYAHFTIAPQITDALTYASAYVDTVRGRVASSWRKSGDGLEVTIQIPPNARARVVIPTMGKKLEESEATPRPVAQEGETLTFSLGSGRYMFTLR